ncbi:MAG: type II secretion system F family protein [Kineosporiaceae bacterium]
MRAISPAGVTGSAGPIGEVVDRLLGGMSSTAGLYVGAVMVAGAAVLAGAVAVSAIPSSGRRRIEDIDRLRPLPTTARGVELDQPFRIRALDPALGTVVRLGRLLTPSGQVRRLERRLALAGHPAQWSVDRVLTLQVLGAVVAGGVAGLLGLLLDVGGLRTALLAGFGLIIGWLGPVAHVSRLASGRSTAILRDLPDSLDLLTISVEAGLGFDAALAYVARNDQGPVGREFSRVLQEMQLGTSRSHALRAMADRTDVEGLRTFASALIQAETFGVPMAKALRVQSEEIRVKRRQRAEEQAQKVPIKILFPLIFGIMPVLFLVIIGPAAVQAFRSLSGVGL